MHRLNRTEYANAIRDLLGLDVDAAALLPPDDESSGFDNIADVLTVSPSLMERYLSASWNISRMAVGNLQHRARARPSIAYGPIFAGPARRRAAARERAAEFSFGTHFPLDGEYTIKVRLWRNTFDLMRGMEDPHDIEIAMDGSCLKLVSAGGREEFMKMAENPGTFGADLDQRLTVRMPGESRHSHALGNDGAEKPRVARRPDQAVPADDRRRPRHHGRSFSGPPDHRRSLCDRRAPAIRRHAGRSSSANRRRQAEEAACATQDPVIAWPHGLPQSDRQSKSRHVMDFYAEGARTQRQLR